MLAAVVVHKASWLRTQAAARAAAGRQAAGRRQAVRNGRRAARRRILSRITRRQADSGGGGGRQEAAAAGAAPIYAQVQAKSPQAGGMQARRRKNAITAHVQRGRRAGSRPVERCGRRQAANENLRQGGNSAGAADPAGAFVQQKE